MHRSFRMIRHQSNRSFAQLLQAVQESDQKYNHRRLFIVIQHCTKQMNYLYHKYL